MTDIQISCFLSAARQLIFTKASQELFITQPSVSRYISSFEKSMGEMLFKYPEVEMQKNMTGNEVEPGRLRQIGFFL